MNRAPAPPVLSRFNPTQPGAQGMKVVATGGLAEVVAQETDVIQIIAPWLTLDGLRILWDLNHPL